MRLTMKKAAVRSIVVAVILLAMAIFAEAQQQEKVPRIGYLSTDSTRKENVEGLRLGLRELGYVEGKTIAIEYRYADGVDRLPISRLSWFGSKSTLSW